MARAFPRSKGVGRIAALAALSITAACSGQIGDPEGKHTGSGTTGGSGSGSSTSTGSVGTGTGTGVGSTTGTGGTTTGGTNPPPLDCSTPKAPAMQARLLSPSQYNNTVLDLVKVGGNPSKDFSGSIDGQLDELSVERRANAAADVARQAALSLSTWSPCTPPQVAAAMCEQQIIDRIGSHAYRHPLTEAERTELQILFDAGVKEKDFATGVEWFLTGVFQSPDFLYQFAKVQPGETAGQVRPLSGYEMASRLSYFVWDSTPDDALYTAASANDLGEPSRLQAQVARMVQDQRFLRGVTSFYGSWLRLSGFGEVARDDAAFTTELVGALETSLLMSATELYASGTPNIAGLFTGQGYYMNGVLRGFYGLGGNRADTAFTAVQVPGEDRVGLLTHPALMALLARPNETNPIARGLFVRKALMCQDMPPPPAGIAIPQLPPISPNLSTRDRLDQHTKAALCASCHDMIDPPGFALENFDQVGRHRTVEGGKAVDTSGKMTEAGDLAGAFANGAELLKRFAESQDVRSCFAQTYFEHAASHAATDEDQCTLEALKKSFNPSGDLKGLVASIATGESFRLRLSEGGAP